MPFISRVKSCCLFLFTRKDFFIFSFSSLVSILRPRLHATNQNPNILNRGAAVCKEIIIIKGTTHHTRTHNMGKVCIRIFGCINPAEVNILRERECIRNGRRINVLGCMGANRALEGKERRGSLVYTCIREYNPEIGVYRYIDRYCVAALIFRSNRRRRARRRNGCALLYEL